MVAIFEWRRPIHILFAVGVGIWSGYYIWEPPLRNAVKLSNEMRRQKALEDKRLRAMGIEPVHEPEQSIVQATWEHLRSQPSSPIRSEDGQAHRKKIDRDLEKRSPQQHAEGAVSFEYEGSSPSAKVDGTFGQDHIRALQQSLEG